MNTALSQNPKTSFTSGYAPVNGIKMYYEIYGEGKIPLVLIHGGGSTIQSNFGNVIPMLSENRKIIAMDLQAHGRTEDRDTPVSFEQDADDIAALLTHLGIDKADFFGFSNGGNTAMKIGMRHPEIVNKLVIASSFYQRNGLPPGFFEGMKNASLENMPTPLKEAFLDVNPDKKGLQTMHDKDKERVLRFKDWKDEALQSIKAPSLILIGDRDIVLPEHAAKMSRMIPNARLMILPANHGSYIAEICTVQENSKTPEATIILIEEFLTAEGE